ncbi:hypothetical protein G5I_02386 [Acromyrmex echinatior]|uniref:Uncharacterized protein n=1 Tax=Acromyrmex echinatior TaxID=103372 RepID=F4WA66_ACREC|nr:hypothetical protein G5I_02386 [Acromyrmex echinatior]
MLGHCGGDTRLMEIISHYLEVRECINHEEDNAAGYIADFKRRAGVSNCIVGRAIPHRGGHPLGRHSLKRRRPAEQAINEVVPVRSVRIEAERDYTRNERNIPVVVSLECLFLPYDTCQAAEIAEKIFSVARNKRPQREGQRQTHCFARRAQFGAKTPITIGASICFCFFSVSLYRNNRN